MRTVTPPRHATKQMKPPGERTGARSTVTSARGQEDVSRGDADRRGDRVPAVCEALCLDEDPDVPPCGSPARGVAWTGQGVPRGRRDRGGGAAPRLGHAARRRRPAWRAPSRGREELAVGSPGAPWFKGMETGLPGALCERGRLPRAPRCLREFAGRCEFRGVKCACSQPFVKPAMRSAAPSRSLHPLGSGTVATPLTLPGACSRKRRPRQF